MWNRRSNDIADRGFAVDTTFVLFFLAVDFGQSVNFLGARSLISLFTLGLIVVLPYLFPSEVEKPAFIGWLAGRSLITLLAIGLGMMFRQSLGVVFPEEFRFLPMTFVILTAMLSCYLQFYAMIRFRLAR